MNYARFILKGLNRNIVLYEFVGFPQIKNAK